MTLRLAVLGLLCVFQMHAADWPQFLGPNASSTAVDGQLAHSWPTNGPREVWQVNVAPGFGAAAIQGGKVYLLDRGGNTTDVLRCLDFVTGKEEWSLSYDAPGKVSYPGSRSTPSVDDKYIVTVGSFGHVQCVDKATHQRLWMHNLLEEYPQKKPLTWGVAQSPLLYKNWVIVAPQNKDASMVAFDKATGKLAWKAAPVDGALETSYGSPMLANVNGVDQIVTISQVADTDERANIFGVNAADGKLLWNFTGWGCGISIPQPVYCGDGRFFVTGGYNANSAMIKVELKDGAYAVSQIFNGAGEITDKTPKPSSGEAKPGEGCSSHMHTPVLFRGCIYANGNSKQNTSNGLVCMGLDGAIKWKTGKAVPVDLGDLIVVDDLLVSLAGDGTLRLAEATPTAYKQLAEARVLAQKKQVWAGMSFADGKLFVRDNNVLKCLDLRAK